jgi:uncharacterized protein (TIRG00374 family)
VRASATRAGLVVLGLVCTIAFGYIAVRDVDPDAVRDAFGQSNAWWLLPALVVFAVSIFLRAWRWQLLFEPGKRPPLGAVTRALLVSYLFNNVLPARAGEAARIVALRAAVETPRAETFATVIIERIFDVISLLVLFFTVAFWLPEVSWLRTAALLGGVAALGLIAVVVVIWRYDERAVAFLARPLKLVPRLSPERLELAVHHVVRGCAALRRADVALSAFAVTTASWLVMAASFWLLMLGFDLGVGPGAGILVVVTVNLTLVLPSSPGGLGLFEAATVVALHAYGIPQSQALSYGLVLHAMNFFPFIVIGVAIMARHPMLRRAVRGGAADAAPVEPVA